jgi:hypothetical protein
VVQAVAGSSPVAHPLPYEVPAPMRTLQEWMGHRDYRTTLIYADYSPIAHERDLVERAFGGHVESEAEQLRS